MRRVLVVDDEADLRDLIAEYLSDRGLEVMTAGSGDEAFVLYKAFLPAVVVTDVRMPQGDGISLMKNIRAEDGGDKVTVVVMSGFADLKREEILDFGADFFIEKPFTLRALSALITPRD